jgi:hypothetical protein
MKPPASEPEEEDVEPAAPEPEEEDVEPAALEPKKEGESNFDSSANAEEAPIHTEVEYECNECATGEPSGENETTIIPEPAPPAPKEEGESIFDSSANAEKITENTPITVKVEQEYVDSAHLEPSGESEPLNIPEPAAPTPKIEGDSIFDSSADLEDILSAMEDVKQDEAESIAKAVKAIELGETGASEMLAGMSTDIQDKIQKTLDQRSLEQKQDFVTEEDFVAMASTKTDRTWYHCLFYLAFNSEDGSAGKKILYDALKNDLSKSPVDPLPEHMFNFGLSSLVKVQLYDKPLVGFKKSTFTLQFDRKKLQELLLQIGRPLSKRPIITKKEEQKMIEDFFSF